MRASDALPSQRIRCRRWRAAAGLAIVLAAMASLAAGCEPEYRVISSGWDQLPQDPKPGEGDEAAGLQAEGWTLLLHQFTGPRREEEAHRLVRRLEDEAGMDELWISEAAGTTSVYRGRYGDQRAARRVLQRTQRVRLEGESLLQNAVLAPLGRGSGISDDPLDLSQHSGQFSLQIGYFDEEYDGDRHDAAEAVVDELREAGHEAYYYHGPHRSLVTLGVYTHESAFVTREDPRAPGSTVSTYAGHIRELQQRFPYNLGNTADLIDQQQQSHDEETTQPSGLVRVF